MLAIVTASDLTTPCKAGHQPIPGCWGSLPIENGIDDVGGGALS
jgi:hypothetical protein